MRRSFTLLPLAFALVACEMQTVRTSESGDSAAVPSVDSAAASISDTAPGVLSELGFGPARVGMTLAEIEAAVGQDLGEAGDPACSYVTLHLPPGGDSSGVRLMMVDGRLARVDVSDSSITTEAGARVGDTEVRVLEMYGSRARIQPHKYVEDGRYLIVPRGPGADSVERLVFETANGRVTAMRGGRLPEVEWVEGCG
ncbi:MAG TPA: hypothetical protein VFG84_06635 [Gemmatimonadaceae bacterium]|nr:hypothetical protein [Gemmatimonadaceae bacterium]